MRLLNVQTGVMEVFADSNDPRIENYAILSHTWGDDELAYDDVASLSSLFERPELKKAASWLSHTMHKKRFTKIEGALATARKDKGIKYIWIDTCCINKDSSSELQEAINSMFDWYKNSKKCYAYLSDVDKNRELITVEGGKENKGRGFKDSRWFSRGWTLQELIAPKEVEFFSHDWASLGSKSDPILSKIISGATGIPEAVLKDPENIWTTSVACRMSWAASRKTTKEEDIAYCLLGLFGVNMPLLYGEGMRAFLRLQEEIIEISDDQTIFAWNSEERQESALAQHPANFSGLGDLVSTPSNAETQPYIMTHRGLQIQLRLYESGAYEGDRPILMGALDCHARGDFTQQVVIYLCQSDIPDTYVRCTYLSSHGGYIDVYTAQESQLKSIYIQRQSSLYYRRPNELVCRIKLTKDLLRQVQFRAGHVGGVKSTWTERNMTVQIERAQEKWSRDAAAGFVFYDPGKRDAFIIVVYFPHKSTDCAELCGVQVFAKPPTHSLDDWLKRSTEDLSRVHIRDIHDHPNSEHRLEYMVHPDDGAEVASTSEQGIAVVLTSEKVLNRTVYVVSVAEYGDGFQWSSRRYSLAHPPLVHSPSWTSTGSGSTGHNWS